MTKFDRFYSSGRTFTAFLIIGIVFGVLNTVIYALTVPATPSLMYLTLTSGLILCLLVALFATAIRHQQKSMYILSGALLTALLLSTLELFAYYFEHNGMNNSRTGHALAIAALVALFFISHVKLFTGHSSAKGAVRFNAITGLIVIAFDVYTIILNIVLMAQGTVDTVTGLLAVATSILYIVIINSVTSVEAQLDAYKIEREASMAEGTWTDEKKAETKKKYFGE